MIDRLLEPPIVYLWIALGAIIVLSYLYKLLRPKERAAHMLKVKCPSCGWTGSVGRYSMKCSNCGSSKLLRI